MDLLQRADDGTAVPPLSQLHGKAYWKAQKEAFVSGHSGTTPLELILVCSAVPIGYATYRSLVTARGFISDHYNWSSWGPLVPDAPSTIAFSVMVEFFTLMIPLIVCESNYLRSLGVVYLSLEAAVSVAIFWGIVAMSSFRGRRADAKGERSFQTTPRGLQGKHNGNLDYLSVYRSGLLYLTFVAILAVDFHIFPRRFAKTESAGYSLMDLGAASFVFAAGLVSPRRRHPHRTKAATMDKSLRRITPLLLLGFLRLITHSPDVLDYQEHDTEYGTHWNFFFTLAFLEAFVYVVANGASPISSKFIVATTGWILPTMILALYQYMLSLNGLQAWVLDAPRTCPTSQTRSSPSLAHRIWSSGCYVLHANREGILGCIGYSVLFLYAEWIGATCLWFNRSTSETRESKPYSSLTFSTVVGPLSIMTVCMILVWRILVNRLGIPVSRRTTNSSFIVWTIAQNLVQLLALKLIDASFQLLDDRRQQHSATPRSTVLSRQHFDLAARPPISNVVNRYGLIMFVIANLLTGAINISTNTLLATDGAAFTILLGYISAIGTIASTIAWISEKSRAKRDSSQSQQSREMLKRDPKGE
jgi:glucosaminylphosphatidylinositol acyltransferase